ncbi:GNAT family N-acetyltransferase [Candidatus Daviesbacteria bacterium]|nr:GNAT family N-acetyltransferase [Candidatus Daviesbacteria bacterium]
MEPKIVFQGQTKTGKKVIIRYPTMDDLLPMLNFINTISVEQTFVRPQGEQFTLEQEEDYLKDQLEKIEAKKVVKLIAFIDGKFVGTADIFMKAQVESHVGVFGIIVANGYRSEGIGRLLMENVIKESLKEMPQLRIVELSVFANNPLALDFYKKMGFIEFGRLPEGVLHRGQYVDHIYMYKKL